MAPHAWYSCRNVLSASSIHCATLQPPTLSTRLPLFAVRCNDAWAAAGFEVFPTQTAARPPNNPLSTPRREVARPKVRVSSSKRRSSMVRSRSHTIPDEAPRATLRQTQFGMHVHPVSRYWQWPSSQPKSQQKSEQADVPAGQHCPLPGPPQVE